MNKKDKKSKTKKRETTTSTMYDCCWYDSSCYDLCCGDVCCCQLLGGVNGSPRFGVLKRGGFFISLDLNQILTWHSFTRM